MLKHVSFAHMMSPNAHFSWPNQSVFLHVFLRKEQVKKKEIYESCMLMPISWKIKFNITLRIYKKTYKLKWVFYFPVFSFKKVLFIKRIKNSSFFCHWVTKNVKNYNVTYSKISLLWLLKLIITRKKSYLNI